MKKEVVCIVEEADIPVEFQFLKPYESIIISKS